EKGEKGDRGDQGLQGLKGDKGDRGDTGLQGIQGIQGVKGDTGANGLQGIQGETGSKGDTGTQGVKGDTGANGLQGLQGLQGPRGDQGLQGAKGDKGDQGSQGIQGVQGPKGDPASCCCSQGPVGATGAKGDTGTQGIQGEQGKAGVGLCPCELIFGKSAEFLLDNDFDFEATINAPFEQTLSSTSDEKATIYNTWALEFSDETLVPFCKFESFTLSFTTEQEKNTFVSLFSTVLNQTLSCCHSCGTCDVCPDELPVDSYNSIVNMPETCAYEYYLNAECDCFDSNCDTIAKKIDLCSFANSTGEKLRHIIDRKQSENKAITLISTEKAVLIDETLTKTIETTGLSSVLVSYEQDGTFKVTLVCLQDVTQIKFTDVV
ncbi:MAG: hypothetical protein R3Y09_08880, partial [Clostridia bacterium]